jgi:hypothetical protein
MRTLSRYLVLSLAVVGLSGLVQACARPEPEAVTLDAFKSMRWLDGRWVGSGGAYAAFYEEYRITDDSSIVRLAFADSTFATPSDTALIEWRAGSASSGDVGVRKYSLVSIHGDTVRFAPATEGRSGFTWIRLSDSTWRAVLDATPANIVYEMRRIPNTSTP